MNSQQAKQIVAKEVRALIESKDAHTFETTIKKNNVWINISIEITDETAQDMEPFRDESSEAVNYKSLKGTATIVDMRCTNFKGTGKEDSFGTVLYFYDSDTIAEWCPKYTKWFESFNRSQS